MLHYYLQWVSPDDFINMKTKHKRPGRPVNWLGVWRKQAGIPRQSAFRYWRAFTASRGIDMTPGEADDDLKHDFIVWAGENGRDARTMGRQRRLTGGRRHAARRSRDLSGEGRHDEHDDTGDDERAQGADGPSHEPSGSTVLVAATNAAPRTAADGFVRFVRENFPEGATPDGVFGAVASWLRRYDYELNVRLVRVFPGEEPRAPVVEVRRRTRPRAVKTWNEEE